MATVNQSIETTYIAPDDAQDAQKEAEQFTVTAAPATVTIPAKQVREAIEGRLTTAERETGADAANNVVDRLLTVKSLVTLLMAACFAYLSITGTIEAEQFMTVFTTVIAFYFGVQTVKGKE